MNTRALLPLMGAALLSIAAAAVTDSGFSRVSAVDPFIGTGGHGHTFPGAVVPHGMIQPSPDTRINGWDACSGYHDSDTLINGFTQNHLSGTGCADLGDFLIIPTVGPQVLDPQIDTLQNRAYASNFSKSDEVAKPGYYSTYLKRYGVKAEVTSTPRSAIYRFTYPETDEAGLILDLDYSIQSQHNLAMDVHPIGDRALGAFKNSWHWIYHQPMYLYAEFSEPFTYEVVRDTLTDAKGNPMPRCKALLKFPEMKKGQELLVKLAISAVDEAGARNNLLAEQPGWDFEGVQAQAENKWEETLGKIDITTDDPEDRTIFYTALYHSNISPYLFQDADGRYLGMDLEVHQGDTARPMYTVFSLWDTHRALHPLYTIIDPETNQQYIRTLLQKYREGRLLPMWELNGNYTACMTGYHAVSLMADAIAKGYTDFDIKTALEAGRKSAGSELDTNIVATPYIQRCLMPKSKEMKNALGFVPWDTEWESVAKGLEYAYDDWCISRIAEAAGDKEAMKEFEAKGQYYRNYYDPETRFFRGKGKDGKWHEPFTPNSSNHRGDDYCEGTAWQWSWYAPHDIDGLISLLGGREAFVERLDSLFAADSSLTGELISADISGLIGQYAHGNEPSHHIIHLYNYAGRPDRTQKYIDQVLKEMYSAAPDGLSGNEDCGQMSAWYVLNALGFYQVCPGIPVYSIGRPWFPHAEVNLPGGKKLVINVKGYGKDRPYIKSVRLNGKRLSEPFFTHADIAGGATLDFEMTDSPE